MASFLLVLWWILQGSGDFTQRVTDCEEFVGEVNHTLSCELTFLVSETFATNQYQVADPSLLIHHPFEWYYQYQADHNHSNPST